MQPFFRMTHMRDVLLGALWALLLLVLGLAVNAIMAGDPNSGPMHLGFPLLLYMLAFPPVFVLSYWAQRFDLGLRLTRWGGLGLALVCLWWVFWLPAPLVDTAYALRYSIPDPYVYPATPFAQVFLVAGAVWLLASEPREPARRFCLRGVVYLGLTLALALASDALATWARQDQPLGLVSCAGLGLLAVLIVAWRIRPRHGLWRLCSIWLVLQSLLLLLWVAVYHYGDALPQVVNAFGAQLIYGPLGAAAL